MLTRLLRIGDKTPWRQIANAEKPTSVSGHTGSAMAEALIKGWMQACERNHSCCSHEDSTLPTRILDIRKLESVYLHCPKKGEKGAYACLSHCWGSTRTFCTTSANISQHQSFIEWKSLPQVYQQAITTAFNLGIPFIWIDSLCIIQDLEEDWQKESATMAEIYAHSALTIAASLAKQDSDSMFISTPGHHCSMSLRKFDCKDIFIRKTLDHGHGPTPLPLLNRAWVLQERLLSPRVIHFTDQELVWECMERLTCECGCIRSLWSPGHVPFDKDLLHKAILERSPKQEVKERWRRLVHEYSRLHLTMDRDKLPAISGAAKRFSTYFRGDYLAGLWRDGLLSDLLWEREGSHHSTQISPGVPSWSWMRPGVQVKYDDCMATDEAALVVSASCNHLRDEDPFGQVMGGEVRIMATMKPISGFINLEGAQNVWHAGSTSVTGRHSDYKVELILDDVEGAVYTVMSCAKIALRRTVYRNTQDEAIWLVLAPASLKPDCYTRVGILKTRYGTGTSALEDDVEQEPVDIVII